MSDLRKDREQEREREKDREEQSEKERGQLERENLKAGTAIFYNLVLVVMFCHFYYMLLVIQTIPERAYKRYSLEISGDHVRGCLPD